VLPGLLPGLLVLGSGTASQPPTALHTVPAGQQPYMQQVVPFKVGTCLSRGLSQKPVGTKQVLTS
jgi:hypothetical protein